jgi:tetratricopeptide (TPR) repeat protein
MTKKYLTFIAVSFFFLVSFSFAEDSRSKKPTDSQAVSFEKEDQLQRIFRQSQIIEQGDILVKQGRYENAILKYSEALNTSFVVNDDDRMSPIGRLERVCKLQGNYKQALEQLQWFINQNTNGSGWHDDKSEIESLIKTRDTHSNGPVLGHIEYLKNKYEAQLPPKKYAFGFTPIISSAIIRLYDHIGDFEDGIAFVKGVIAYLETRPVLVQSKNEYMKILEAFEQEKREGWKGCVDFKPNQSEPDTVCMGKATKALIQSDYFPW